jgi:hypothetical protein
MAATVSVEGNGGARAAREDVGQTPHPVDQDLRIAGSDKNIHC